MQSRSHKFLSSLSTWLMICQNNILYLISITGITGPNKVVSKFLLGWQVSSCRFFPVISLFTFPHIFSRPTSFLQKKQWKGLTAKRIFWIVQWSVWSGVVFLEKFICMCIIRSASMSWLTWCTLFLIWTHISRVIDENVRKMTKNGDLKTRIYGSKNISSCRA